jgi:HSP20 family protein
MSNLDELRSGLSRAWEQLAEGWSHMRRRAGQALTRFHRKRPADEAAADTELVAYNSAPWGLLAAELRENGDRLVVKLEAPGMNAEDFDIDVVDDYLVVRGEKQVGREETQGRFHIMECAYGSFERAIPLPMPVDPGQAKARYRRGVLTVTLEKPSKAKARRIEVQS